MTKQQEIQLKLEIEHIFDSGANEMRIFDMLDRFITKSLVESYDIGYKTGLESGFGEGLEEGKRIAGDDILNRV